MEEKTSAELNDKVKTLNKNLKQIDAKMIRLVDHRKHIYRKIKGLTKRIARIDDDKKNQTL